MRLAACFRLVEILSLTGRAGSGASGVFRFYWSFLFERWFRLDSGLFVVLLLITFFTFLVLAFVFGRTCALDVQTNNNNKKKKKKNCKWNKWPFTCHFYWAITFDFSVSSIIDSSWTLLRLFVPRPNCPVEHSISMRLFQPFSIDYWMNCSARAQRSS